MLKEDAMPEARIVSKVRRPAPEVSVIDIEGEVTAFGEPVLMEAYSQASAPGARAIVLNFSALDYMNSGGIGLLVTLLIRAQRQGQRLLAYGLNDHYQQIFQLTRLNEAISLYENEPATLAAVSGS
jgi:anti-sigma B factor antagonist